MRFGDAVKALATSVIERAASRVGRQQFVDLITKNDFYTPPPAKTRDLLGLYNSNLWVRTIVEKVSKAGARQKWYLEKEGGSGDGERITKHPALDFLNRGTKRLPGRTARQLTITHRDLTGEAFWAIGLDKAGTPVEFAPIPPDWVQDVPVDDDPGGVFVIVNKPGTQFRIPANQVLWFREPDPLDPYGRGSSFLRAVRTELQVGQSVSEYLDTYFKNRARPDLIISGSKDAPIGEKDRGRLEETWLQKFRGVKRAGQPFFSSGPLTITEFGNNLRDNEMSKISDWTKTTVAEFYGVPPEVLGRLDNSNRATIDSADYLFAKGLVDPRLAGLLDTIEPFLREHFDLEGLELHYETPIQDDNAFNLSVMQARPGAFSNNEWRVLRKLKPLTLPGFDEPQPDPATDPNADPAGGPPKPGKKPADKPADKPKKSVNKTISPEDIVAVSAAHEDPQVRAEVTKIVEGIFSSLLNEYGAELLGVLESDARFTVTAAVAEFIANEVPSLIGFVDQTTRNALRASLVEGSAKNEAVEALAKRVEQIFADAAETRAEVIGITSATKITGFGSLEAARQAGFGRKKWLDTADQLVRDSHRALNGQVKQLSEPFQSPRGGSAQHPGGFHDPAEDIHCRCALRPILDGEAKAMGGVTDQAFEAAWVAAHATLTKKLKNTWRKIFIAQSEVALAQLRRKL